MKHYAFENAAVRLAGVDATREFLEPIFVHRETELLVAAMCDDNLRLIRLASIPGDEVQVTIPLPKLMRMAVTNRCTGIVIAHNHPSGELRPSKRDLAFTKRLRLAAESVGITLIDHLIFNGSPVFSFRRQGLL